MKMSTMVGEKQWRCLFLSLNISTGLIRKKLYRITFELLPVFIFYASDMHCACEEEGGSCRRGGGDNIPPPSFDRHGHVTPVCY